jgi:outer membrane protein
MKKFFLTIAAVTLAAPMFAQSAPQRVAVVDVQRVLTTSNPGKAAYERLKKMQEDRIARAKTMDEDVRKLDADIAAKRISLSEDKLAEMGKQLADKKIVMQRFAQDADREVGEARDKALAELETRIKPVIDGLGKEMGLAAIFNKFESGLVYASDAIDVTDAVIKRLNETSGTAAAVPAATKK